MDEFRVYFAAGSFASDRVFAHSFRVSQSGVLIFSDGRDDIKAYREWYNVERVKNG